MANKFIMKQFLFLICAVFLYACQPITANLTPTRSLVSQCPKEDLNLEFDVQSAWASTASDYRHQDFTEYVLDFLDSGGSPQAISSALDKFYDRQITSFFQVLDVTGDNIPELIASYGIWIDIFSCIDGKYELKFTDTYESNLNGVSIIDITDINQNGLAEIVVYFNGCMGNRCPIIRIYEWSGKDFQGLIESPSITDGCGNLLIAPFDVEIRDTDNNGTKEIILKNNGYPHLDNDFPYRKETRICMWDGQNFVIHKNEFDAPYYRFQAVQDGDRATLSGDYDKAFSFYQQAINDKKLEWFTQDRKWHDFWVYHSEIHSEEPSPTASPTLIQDPNEYPSLAAYAYYRIMLLYILQDDSVNAEITFNKLESEFPLENSGNYFVKVASVFLQDYQLSNNIENSCTKVIGYTQENHLPIEYLGDWDHGVHSMQYFPETICPFK